MNWIKIFEKLLYITIRQAHIFNSQEPTGVPPNCLRLIIWQGVALNLPKLCVMVLDHMIQDHN